MRKQISHWKKAESRENQQLILRLLNEFGPTRFNELCAKINETSKISQPTLSKHLKQLKRSGKIERYWNKKKAADCYRIKPQNREKVEAQIQKYEAIKFIEAISESVYTYETMPNGKGAVAAFANIPGKSRQLVEPILKGIVKGSTPLLAKAVKLSNGEKIALVIMMTGNVDDKEGVKP